MEKRLVPLSVTLESGTAYTVLVPEEMFGGEDPATFYGSLYLHREPVWPQEEGGE